MPLGKPAPNRHNGELDILIVENDPAMARLTGHCFHEAGLKERLVSLPDGDQALDYLCRRNQYANAPHVDLICLDLHLPRKSGLQVLAEIKSNPYLKLTPVLVVSGSENPEEVRKAYELHASCFIRKPNDLDSFLRFIKVCFEFWGSVVSLPPKPPMVAANA